MGLSITPIEVVLTGLEGSREAVRALCDAGEIAARFFSRRENEVTSKASAMGISSVR